MLKHEQNDTKSVANSIEAAYCKQLFYLDARITFTNHAGLGRSTKKIINKKCQLLIEMETAPDKFFRLTSYQLLERNLSSISDYLNVKKSQLLFCKNVTDGINVILKSIEFNIDSRDAILVTNYTYEPILNAIDYISKYRRAGKPIDVIKVEISLPITSVEQILDHFENTCDRIINEKKLNLRLAVIEHVSSSLAVVFPVERIVKSLKRWNRACTIIVDGAHAFGQVAFDLNNIQSDFYVFNLHKWFLCPYGCGLMYSRDAQAFESNSFQPNYISYGYRKGAYLNFKQRASEDLTSWFVVDECIRVYENDLGGLASIQNYCSKMCDRAADMLAKKWNTQTFALPPLMQAPLMRLIKLPTLSQFNLTDFDCNTLTNRLLEEFDISAYIVKIEHDYYVRISAFVYNTDDDYIKLGDTILKIFNAQAPI